MPRILLVDDEPSLVLSLQEFLFLKGYDVMVAQSGEEGLAKVLESPPDLILSDIMMEDMDGYEFYRRVRALTGARIPWVFLTAKTAHEEILQGLLEGADDYVTKPFDPQELFVRIENILNRIERTRAEEKEQVLAGQSRAIAQWANRLREPFYRLFEELNIAANMSRTLGLDTLSLDRALEHARELGKVIDEIEWSSPEGVERQLKPQLVRVAPVIRRAAARAARQALAKGVQLEIACGGLLTGLIDEEAMARALGGLLEAVVALSLPGAQVSITAKRAADRGLEFTVTEGSARAADIPSEALSNALEMARAVILAHGGKLMVKQTPQGFCSYVAWIPGRTLGDK